MPLMQLQPRLNPTVPSNQADEQAALEKPRRIGRYHQPMPTGRSALTPHEVGWQSILLENKLARDIDAYTNKYSVIV